MVDDYVALESDCKFPVSHFWSRTFMLALKPCFNTTKNNVFQTVLQSRTLFTVDQWRFVQYASFVWLFYEFGGQSSAVKKEHC